MNGRPGIPDEEARELWRRAAELQGAAERRESEHDLEAVAGDAAVLPGPSALPVEQVVAAGTEAGISADHVLLALAERRLLDWDAIRPDRWTARWLRRLVGDADAIETSEFVHAHPGRVLEAIGRVAGEEPFDLSLEDRIGSDPSGGVALVLRMPGGTWNPSPFHWKLDFADGRTLLVTVRPEDAGTRLRIRAPLYRRGLNLALSGGAAGVFAGGSGAAGAAIGQGIAGVLGMAATVAAAGVGALAAAAGAGVGIWAFRSMYGWSRRQGELAVQQLHRAIAAAAEGGVAPSGEPRLRAATSGRPSPDPGSAASVPPLRRAVPGARTVLLVEDEPLVRALLVRLLTEAGYEVLEAAGAEQAIERLAANDGDVDLLLTDVTLPDASGPELAARLAAERKRLPVLYMSGFTDDAVAAGEPLDPDTAFLAKPFASQKLLETIADLLAREPR